MAKRANGEGSIGKYKNGWRSKINIGYDENGKVIRKELYGKTQKEVKEKLEAYKKTNDIGLSLDREKITLEDWYYTWLFDYKQKELKLKSFEKYEGLYRNYIKDSDIGNMKIKDIRATHLQKYYNNLIEQKDKPVSTVSGINTRLKVCFTEAEKQGYIDKNYCKLVTLPKNIKQKEIKVLSLDEQKRFIESIKGNKYEMLFILALGTGMRKGELLGLKWFDIDFSNNVITVSRTLQRASEINRDGTRVTMKVEQSPKTKNSIRTIPVPNDIALKLKSHKAKQNEIKLKSAGLYKDSDYVFCNELGEPLNENKPNKILTTILNKSDIEPIKFHALRHTYATRLFEADVPPKTVQSLLGHSDISITMNIYTHVMEDKKVEAVDKLNSIFSL